MPIPERKHTATGYEDLSWVDTDDGSRTLWNARLNETYHSGCGAIAESMHVYLDNSGVSAQLLSGCKTRVFEVGFGTGTNFWLTAAVAARSGTPLLYSAIESWLLPREVFQALELRLNQDATQSLHVGIDPQLLTLAQSFLEQWCYELDRDALVAKAQQRWPLAENITLELSLGQLELALGNYRDEGNTWQCFDAIYFDAFSPQTSPELWTAEIFGAMYQMLKSDGRLTTYCVKRSVQEALRQAGFEIQKLPGPIGGKREVLVAKKGTEELA